MNPLKMQTKTSSLRSHEQARISIPSLKDAEQSQEQRNVWQAEERALDKKLKLKAVD